MNKKFILHHGLSQIASSFYETKAQIIVSIWALIVPWATIYNKDRKILEGFALTSL